MKVVDVFPKEICVNIEFTSQEISRILDFIEKAMPLYAKVHLDGPIDESALAIEKFNTELKSVSKLIERGIEK